MKLRPAGRQTIKFTIKQDGTVIEEVKDAIGDKCEVLTSEIEKKLGEVESRIHKPEYYQKQENVTDVTLQHQQD